MARNDQKLNTAASKTPTTAQKDRQTEALAAAREAAMSQARAASLARAKSVARAQAMRKAQADARVRALVSDGDEPMPEVEAVEDIAPTTEVEATVAPMPEPVVEEVVQAPVEEMAMETPVPAAEPAAETVKERDPDELEYAIQITDLYKSYGKKQVLKGLNLNVYPGEMFGFIGRNGVGKSTTIDCMIGAKRFDSGEIIVGGYDIRFEPLDAKFSYGYVASEPTCYEVMTGYDYLEFVASIYGLTETEFTGNYQYLCKRLQLNVEELAHHISGYSHGMKQKLCLIASLLHNPNIWVLDEPTVGLDIMAQEELKKMMREYANHGRTVFVTSHNIEMVSAICDRVAIINNGVVMGIYDLNKNPEKRNELARIFIETYGG